MIRVEDVEVNRLAACRASLEAQGMHAENWTIEWDGGPMLINAIRDGEVIREFKATPEVLYERDPYLADGDGGWEAIG